MTRILAPLGAIAAMVVLLESPALAGLPPTPEPEVVGGFAALALIGLGYRYLKGRVRR